jgi:hypothetical protein
MPKSWRLIIGGGSIFLLGLLIGVFVSWRLYQSGVIFNEKEIPNPVIEDAKRGRYDDAISEGLARVHDEHKDYMQYNEVVIVYLMRAYKDEPHREQWVQLAVSYIDKMVELGPADYGSLSQAAYEYDRAGDLAKNGCPLYEKATKVCGTITSILQGGSLMIREEKFPTKELQQDNEALQRRLAKKIDAWCSNQTP